MSINTTINYSVFYSPGQNPIPALFGDQSNILPVALEFPSKEKQNEEPSPENNEYPIELRASEEETTSSEEAEHKSEYKLRSRPLSHRRLNAKNTQQVKIPHSFLPKEKKIICETIKKIREEHPNLARCKIKAQLTLLINDGRIRFCPSNKTISDIIRNHFTWV
jgi:hypothetical protein